MSELCRTPEERREFGRVMSHNTWAFLTLGRQLAEGRRISRSEVFAAHLVELRLNDATAHLLERMAERAPVWETPEAVDLQHPIVVELFTTALFSPLRGDLLGEEFALMP
jgi:hypothetical protein